MLDCRSFCVCLGSSESSRRRCGGGSPLVAALTVFCNLQLCDADLDVELPRYKDAAPFSGVPVVQSAQRPTSAARGGWAGGSTSQGREDVGERQRADGRGQRAAATRHDVALNAGVGVAVELEVHGLAATPARRGLGRTQA